jgi:hypothetical protein
MAMVSLQRTLLLVARVSFPFLSKHCDNHTLTLTFSGAPENVPTIVPRTVNAAYWQRQCSLYFPEVNGHTYGSAKGKSAATVNNWTGGWSEAKNTTRLIWVNG